LSTNKRKNINGFTLIELAIVIALIGIMALFYPKLAQTQINLALNSEAKKLAMDIQFAQSKAIEYQTTINIVFNSNKTGYIIGYGPTTGVENILISVKVQYNITYDLQGTSANPDDTKTLRINSDGTPDGGLKKVVVAKGQTNTINVLIKPAGKVNVVWPTPIPVSTP
jgi:prepilin-type N-terminal cleavage/methylation domain-containing protein